MSGAEGGTVRGSCSCRGVRFEITLPTRFCAHCHCENCRRAHGAAFVTYIGVPDAQLRIVEGDGLLERFPTDTGATRSFCRRCGSTLFYAGPRWPGETHVVLANVEDPIDREPAAHVYFDRAVSWVSLADDLPRLDGTSGSGNTNGG